jgi:Bacterial Ig-like domain (group 2)
MALLLQRQHADQRMFEKESIMKGRLASIGIAFAVAVFAAACSSSPTSSTTIASIAITGSAPTVGSTSQLTATATMSNGTTQDVTSSATWVSGDAAIATVSGAGVVTGVSAGSTTVTATYQSVTASDSIAVILP